MIITTSYLREHLLTGKVQRVTIRKHTGTGEEETIIREYVPGPELRKVIIKQGGEIEFEVLNAFDHSSSPE